MFTSTKRPIVFPQSEHLRLAGAIAEGLGEAGFSFGEISFPEIIRATLVHDRGYPPFDTFGVGETPIDIWVAIHREGLKSLDRSSYVNILVAIHIKNLMKFNPAPESYALAEECERFIESLLSDKKYLRTDFERATKIVTFCDCVAYDFCFEREHSNSVEIPPDSYRGIPLRLMYDLKADGQIILSPLPKLLERQSGLVTAYEAPYYPNQLFPVSVPYVIEFKPNQRTL